MHRRLPKKFFVHCALTGQAVSGEPRLGETPRLAGFMFSNNL